MPRRDPVDPDCAIAQASAVIGDWWSLLVVRDVAGGIRRFDQLQAELQVSRKVLAERLAELIADGVLERRLYQQRPERFEYHLTPAGTGLLPVLVAMQSWAGQHLLGDGDLSAIDQPDSPAARRMNALIGRSIPDVALVGVDGLSTRVVTPRRWTVLYSFPGAYAHGDNGYPPGWDQIPGARGCTLESRTFRDHAADFNARDTAVVGVSTQRPDQLANFAGQENLLYTLLSDANLELAGSLRLPTFTAAGTQRLKRATLIIDREQRIHEVRYPVADPARAVNDALNAIDAITA